MSDLSSYEDKLSKIILKIKGKIPLEEINIEKEGDKREYYKTERLKQIDEVMKLIPFLVDLKINIDTEITDANHILIEIQRNKNDIKRLIKDIDIEI